MLPEAVTWDSTNLNDRWAIFIDIEGFGSLWDSEPSSLRGLHDFMYAVFKIGTSECFANERRIYAHHVGDAFFIVSDFGETSFVRPIAVSSVLMKHLLSRGFFAKAAISSGALSDCSGCYPKVIQDGIGEGTSVALGGGVMTVMSVLGPAMINANRAARGGASGPILVIESKHHSKLPHGIQFRKTANANLLMINWVAWNDDLMERLSKLTDLTLPNTAALEQATKRYMCEHNLSAEWMRNALAHFEPSVWEVA
jgi:hypothetical protein